MANLIPAGFIDFGGTRIAVADISTYNGYSSYSSGVSVDLVTKGGKVHTSRGVTVSEIDKRIRLAQEAAS